MPGGNILGLCTQAFDYVPRTPEVAIATLTLAHTFHGTGTWGTVCFDPDVRACGYDVTYTNSDSAADIEAQRIPLGDPATGDPHKFLLLRPCCALLPQFLETPGSGGAVPFYDILYSRMTGAYNMVEPLECCEPTVDSEDSVLLAISIENHSDHYTLVVQLVAIVILEVDFPDLATMLGTHTWTDIDVYGGRLLDLSLTIA